MSHRVALYQVRVRPKRKTSDWLLLGDYDGAGTWLGETVRNGLRLLNGSSRDGKVVARFEGDLPALEPSQIGATLVSGRSGVTSVLEKAGEPSFERTPDHVEGMRSAALFYLPRRQTRGRLAVHVPHGRSCKGILENELRRDLSQRGYVLDLSPIVPPDALRSAVERDAIEKVTLIKHDPARSERFRDAARWGTDEVGRLELSIPSKRNRRLRRDPLRRFLEDPSDENRRAIIEFQGLQFDEVAVTVDLPDGSQRTFYLEPREGGHPMTIAIDPDETDRLGATPASLSRELKKVLLSVKQ
ncbi:MAG TPA: hypothetical protein ENI86_08945 [Acidimicrobiales bacterium]|nr:hypothetical protein [Acidimicrobiales bacterium]